MHIGEITRLIFLLEGVAMLITGIAFYFLSKN
jgi:hypothetical protein